MKSTGSFLVGLLSGAAIGAALGLLYAPDKGHITRKKLSRKADDMKDEFNGKLDEMREYVNDSLGLVRDKVSDVKEKVEDMKSKVNKKETEVK
jgi:gas vesicle protein